MFQLLENPERFYIISQQPGWPCVNLSRPLDNNLVLAVPDKAEDLAHKFHIKINCKDFSPKSIQIKFEDNNLIVFAKEGQKLDEGDFNVKEFKSTYKMPENVDKDKISTFFTAKNVFNVEIPFKEEAKTSTPHADFEIASERTARIIEDLYGKKVCIANLSVPQTVDVGKIVVSHKNREVIAQTEYPSSESGVKYFRRCTFPLNEDIDFDALKCVFKNGQLEITAPIRPFAATTTTPTPTATSTSKQEDVPVKKEESKPVSPEPVTTEAKSKTTKKKSPKKNKK